MDVLSAMSKSCSPKLKLPRISLAHKILTKVGVGAAQSSGSRRWSKVVTELIEIPGDKDFRDSIERLVHALAPVSGR